MGCAIEIDKVMRSLLITIFFLFNAAHSAASEIKIAVASNFVTTMEKIVNLYHATNAHTVTLISGSSGKHYAQIKNGAPYDIFYAANKSYPQKLASNNYGEAASLYQYASGQLVLWSARKSPVSKEHLHSSVSAKIAIANPRLAPYGRAAHQVLNTMGLWETLNKRVVRGENINQAFQFVATGNAEYGFVALSQLRAIDGPQLNSYWRVPQEHYDPIDQYAILLKDGPAQRSFYEFCRTKPIQALIEDNGYRVEPMSL